MMRAMLWTLTVLEFVAGVLFVVMGVTNEMSAKTVWQQTGALTQTLIGAVFLAGFGITLAVLSLSGTLLMAIAAKRRAVAEREDMGER